MTISGDGGADGQDIEYLLPLYPDGDDALEIWDCKDSELVNEFGAIAYDHFPKLLSSARKLCGDGWAIRLTILGLACVPPEHVWGEYGGDHLEGEEHPFEAYFRKLGLPVHPVDTGGVPRGLTQIVDAMGEAQDRVWYVRSVNHMLRTQSVPPADIVSGMFKAQMRMEAKYGMASLEAAADDPFEAGMLSGKLAALRWLMGDPWDSLDT